MDELDALINEGWEAAQKTGAVAKAASDAPEPEPDDTDDDGGDEEEEDAPATVPDDDDGDADEEGTDGGDDEPEEAKAAPELGSEAKPFRLKDLDGKFVQVKINGELVTMPARELTEDRMRQKDFDERAHRIKQLTSEAERVARDATQQLQTYQRGVMSLLTDAEALGTWLENHAPGVKTDLTLAHYPEVYQEHEAGTYDQWKARRELALKERLLSQRLKAQQQAERDAEQRRMIKQRQEAVFPAIRDAIKATGFDRPSREQLQEIGFALNAREQAKGSPLTSDEIKGVAIRWFKTYGASDDAPAKQGDRKPRHRKAPPATQAKRSTNGASKRSGGPEKYDQFGNLSTQWLLSQT